MVSNRGHPGGHERTSLDVAVEEFRRENAKDLAVQLRGFAAQLARSQVNMHAQDFLPEVLKRAEQLQLKRVAIADACQMSMATISRWGSREVKPHPVVARAAIQAIRDMALRKAKECQNEARGGEHDVQDVHRASRVAERA